MPFEVSSHRVNTLNSTPNEDNSSSQRLSVRHVSNTDKCLSSSPTPKLPIDRFRQAAQFVTNLMPNKSNGEAGVKPQYWLEIRDPKHRDRLTLNGFDIQSGALAAWKQDVNTKLNLFDWVDQHPESKISTLKDNPKYVLSEKLQNINYLTPQQSLIYSIVLSDGKWMQNDSILDTTHLAGKEGMEGHAIIVVHKDSSIYVHPYEKGKWQHTSTTNGQPVLSAGMIKIEQGKATSFHLDSGHYTPSLPQLKNLLILLAKKGVDIHSIDIHAKKIDQFDIINLLKIASNLDS
ncbi:hypothetical protein [Spartinivicinus ruber]|uniref:hypothetical protein n=1 Tax=Spartinivicinus ruber TaxID=2683272 RepID=UPI0013D26005|nr:hypothetical protein [Spartinivicinus ruber]